MTPFITIPETQLLNGTLVPAFQVAQFLSTPGDINPAGAPCAQVGHRQPRQAAVTPNSYPWTKINYADAKQAATAAGFQLLTESQALAIATLIAQQDINWTGGKVGEGALYQGLHKDTADRALPANFGSSDPEERRWHELPSGDRIWDIAGNALTWVFDDIQGDENGLTTLIKADSPSLTTAPYPSREKGMGWHPDGQRDWSGLALVRGGCWRSGSHAGAFRLNGDWPAYRLDYVGFRCTKPVGL